MKHYTYKSYLSSAYILIGMIVYFLGNLQNPQITIVSSEGEIILSVEEPQTPEKATAKVLTHLINSGYFYATVDSVTIDDLNTKAFVTKGCRFRIAEVLYVNHENTLTTEEWQSLMVDIPSFRDIDFDATKVEAHVKMINTLLEERGFLQAFVSVSPPDITEDCTLSINFLVNAGNKTTLEDHLFSGVNRNDIDYLKRVTGIRRGDVITPRNIRNARINLENTDLFESVEVPLLASRDDSFFLFHEVVERRANAFDILFGYVPEPGGGNTLIGQGNLTVRNALLSGSTLDISFERLQLLTTKVNFDYSSRWILRTPFGAGFAFSFLQQDSTYTTRNFHLRGTYNLSSTTEIIGTLRQESVSTNTLSQASEVNQALDGDAFFGGVGIEYRLTDRRRNPTRGVEARILAESGFRRITDIRIENFDVERRFPQQVVHGFFRAYMNFFPRQVIVPSVHAHTIISGEYSRTDLIRFGGAKSLRGYNEDQFRANRIVWGDVEYRYLLDRFSYAFIFGALGYYERPILILEQSNSFAVNQWLNSYGLGFAYNTPIGMIRFTYAISPEESFSNGKVHFGLTANL